MSAPNHHAYAGRLGALTKWGHCTDRTEATAAARRAAAGRWVREVRAEFPDLDERDVIKMADARKRAYFTRLGKKSGEVRRSGRAAA